MTAKDTSPQQVAVALRTSVGMLMRRIRQSKDGDELTLPESTALARLDRGGPATAAELARQEQISPQSMGATLAALQERGLIERRPDPQDGRRIVLTVTPAGQAVLNDRRSALAQLMARTLETEFSPAELDQLLSAAPLIERLAQRI